MRPISDIPPVIGSWYRRLDRPQPFQVVACDSAAGIVEIEYFDGTVDEWPLAHWFSLEIAPGDQPQDCSGPFDAGCLDELSADQEGRATPADLDELIEREVLRSPDVES